jgi:hypothetical protein
MAVNEMPFSPVNWGGQDPHGVTTGHHEAAAGAGHHFTERQRRSAATQQGLYALPVVRSPIGNQAQAFGEEYARDNRVSVTRAALVGGVLGWGLVRTAQKMRGR